MVIYVLGTTYRAGFAPDSPVTMTHDDAKPADLTNKLRLARYRGRLVLALLALALAALMLRPLWQPESKHEVSQWPGTIDSSGPYVQLILDYGDGIEKRFNSLTWGEGMTVQAALTLAASFPHGITFSQRGSGEMTFLTAIDGVVNQGGGAGAKNWIYHVNGKPAHESFAVHALRPRDVVLWTYQPHQ
jgi:hypothetical protein